MNYAISPVCDLIISVPAPPRHRNFPGNPFSVPPADSPELAPCGHWPVGVRTVNLVNPGQVDILHFDRATGKAPLYDRPLPVEIWYPATLAAGRGGARHL